MEFVDAARKNSKARIALDGPSGAGKTWTAMVIAKLIAAKIALIDSERDSSQKYAIKAGTAEGEGNWKFAHGQLTDTSPNGYAEALESAARAEFDAVIVDSLSHLWTKTLELIDRGGGWSKAGKVWGPRYQRVIDLIVSYPGHVIATMRAKSGVTIEKDDRTGKTSVKKHGMEAMIRDGAEFEFDLWLNLAVDGTLTVSKSRFGRAIPVGEVYERSQIPDMIAKLLAELDAGVALTPVEALREKLKFVKDEAAQAALLPEVAKLTPDERKEIHADWIRVKRQIAEGGGLF